jgi:hypothetical protein
MKEQAMTDLLFQLANLWIMPFWLLMIFLPYWGWTRRIVSSLWFIAPLALAYVLLVAPQLMALLPVLANPELGSLARLLGTPDMAAIGWIHFLAFDLFVGRWIYLDSHARGISAWWISPCLALTLLFGPAGFLLYLALRSVVPVPRPVQIPSPV